MFKLIKYLPLFIVFFANQTLAQLSGNYTIGGTTSSTNFSTWSDFTTALNNSGVSGNVTVTVMSNLTITSAVQFLQNSTNPTSSTKKITIAGNGKSVTGNLTYELFWLNGIDFLEIKDLTLYHSSTSSTAQGIRFSGGADDNTINNCIVEFTSLSATSTGSAYISFASNNSNFTSTSTTHNGSRNTIKSCQFRTSGSNSSGPFYAIIDQQGTAYYTSVGSDNTFTGNSIKNFYSSAFYIRYVNGEQIISNDISRENANINCAVDSNLFVVRMYYAYFTNRNNYVGKNTIHDLPYKGATGSGTGNYIANLRAIELSNLYGSTSRPITVELNKIYNCYYNTEFLALIAESVTVLDVLTNQVYSIFGTSGAGYGFYSTNSYDVNYIGNSIRKCDFGSANDGSGIMMYNVSIYNSQRNENRMEDNLLDSNIAGAELYGMVCFYDGSWNFKRNVVTRNKSVSSGKSNFYGTLFFFLYNIQFNSNIIANNSAELENYGMYDLNYNTGYSLEIKQNTIYTRESNSSASSYGVYIDDDSYITFEGNLLDMKGLGAGTIAYLNSTTQFKSLDYNGYQTSFPSENWHAGSSDYSNFSAWYNGSETGPNERQVKTKFANVSTNNFKSNSFQTQNIVPTTTSNAIDVLQVNRNLVKSDMGSTENYLDLALQKSTLSLPSSICAGDKFSVSVYIKNYFVDTATNFYIGYSVNSVVTKQLVTQKIKPGDSVKIDFTSPLVLLTAGTNKIKFFLDIPDDNAKNDSLFYTATVKPSPGGSNLTASSKTSVPNSAVYQPYKNQDVTLVNVPVYYDLSSPRNYTNSDYGTASPKKWFASVQAYTASGRSVSGASFTVPTASVKLEVKFLTGDSTLEDSTLTLKIKISDVLNGCDTVYQRNVYIFPKPKVSFSAKSLSCSGDTLLFTNNSTIKNGYLEYSWNFGTGNAADTSNLTEPSFVYTNAKTYSVQVTATTFPYQFKFTQQKTITVVQKPQASFTKMNACIGNDLTIVNNTTPTNATMVWNFSDGKGDITNNNNKVIVQYSIPGTYLVKLTANLSGCIGTAQQKVIVFDKPIPGFSKTTGLCDNDKYTFTNTTTLSNGIFGSKWDFDDNGKTSLDKNPSYIFSSSGTKLVKLIITSEFGCVDSVSKSVSVRESPKVNFTADKFCSISKTSLQNTTPTVTGSVPSYLWDLGDGNTSSADKLTYNWATTGKRTISLTVNLDNGCAGKLSKDIDVLVEPVPDFSANDKCTQDTVFFENKSTTVSGTLLYHWDFGDTDTSTLDKPTHIFNNSVTTNYNVQLTAIVIGGCSASIVKAITIYELPRTCDFDFQTDYAYAFYGAKLEPKNQSGILGGQNNVDYSWTVNGLGNQTSKDVNAAVNYNLGGDGTYTATMIATTRAGSCICKKSNTLVMDRLKVNQNAGQAIQVYPNPVSEKLHIAYSELLGAVSLKLYSNTGQVVFQANEPLSEISVSKLPKGIYYLSIVHEGSIWTSSVIVN